MEHDARRRRDLARIGRSYHLSPPHWRARGILDPDDFAAPSADTLSALVLYVAAAPDTAARRTVAVARKLLTSPTLRDKAPEETV